LLRKKENLRGSYWVRRGTKGGFSREVPMKVFPLVTSNVFNVLPVKETKDKGSSVYDSKNSIGRTFICSIHLELEIHLNIGIKVADMHAMIEVEVLLDSGAMGLFINHALVQNNSIATCVLNHSIPVYNIDRSLNWGGIITEEVTLIMSYQGHQEKAVFAICDLGKASLIIGYTWLCKHNPDIDWENGKVHMTHCPKECNVYLKQMKRRRRLKREGEMGRSIVLWWRRYQMKKCLMGKDQSWLTS
jgi:Retroviral aspartyl protease